MTCSSEDASGSSSVSIEGYRNTDGVVVDGYISGADVFIDEDEDWIADSTESSTTSDNDGKFTIRYSNGYLVSIGGTDLDSQTLLDNLLITHKLNGHTDFKAVTPVTSVAAFMTDASNVNSALGIDASIDIEIFDPVANKGDGGINDFLYEKGNQLTVLAYALQNITNNLASTTETTQDYFKAISEELEKEYTDTSTKVDIETEAFIIKVIDNIIAAKTLTVTDDAKSNVSTALTGVMPIIQVKTDANLTTEIIKFSISNLQTDIVNIANGSASADIINSYTKDIINYIATTQSVDATSLVPDIAAVGDSVSTDEDTSLSFNPLTNDSFVTSAPYAVSNTSTSNGAISLSGSTFSYTPNADFNGSDSFSYTVTQYEKTSTANVNITINPVNDDPVINTASTLEAEENQTSVATISVSDVDTEDTLTLSLGGTDQDSFDLSSENVLTFKTAPDYETKTSYVLTLSLTDGTATVTKDITINIINLNDVAPEFTSEATFAADENQLAIGTVSATDVEEDAITFTVSGSELAITSDGVLTFVNAPDYETKTSYTATITASDTVNTSDQSITININNLNDNDPVFTSSSTLSGDENQTSVATVTATDADGDSLTYTISGSDLAITTDGVLTFVSAPDYESVTSFSATITASDGERTTDQSVTVNVNNLNDNAPVYTAASSLNASENQTSAFTVTATDADGSALTYAISGGADQSSFTINATSGVVVFNTAPDYETKTSYALTVDVLDGVYTVSTDVSINITDVNEAPLISSSSSFSANENQTSVGSVSASDPEGTTITYAISGTDASSMSISSTGVLSFNTAPNYESKNSYSITASAGDDVNTTTQDITVSINDINDVPVATAASYTLDLLPQDQTSKTLTLAGTDEDGDTLTYTIVSNGSYGTSSFSSQDATQTIAVSVTSSGGLAYIIDGTQKKSLTLNVGTTYTFTHPEAHPFRFSTTSDGTHGSGSEYTTGVTTSSGSTVIAVTGSTPTTLYYYCSIHSGMGGSISMSNSNSNAGITYQTSASTQSAQSETFTFKVNDGTVDSSAATISLDLRTDPLYGYQWHLNNTGQTNFATNAGTAGQDLNVDSVIVDGITGNGVKVAIVDDGLEIAHDDLVDNVTAGSYDFVNSDNDPTRANPCPDANDCGGHGTSIAGIVAAKGWNNIGVRGIAPNASLLGFNFLETKLSIDQDKSLGVNTPGGVTADIYNMSYGTGYEDGETSYDLPGFISPADLAKFENGTSNLRSGKGAIYVKSSGNDYDEQSDASCGTGKLLSCTEVSIDNNSTIPYLIIVGALDADGVKTTYSTPGSGLWVSGFGGEYGNNQSHSGINSIGGNKPAIMTVDRSSCSVGYVQSGVNPGSGSNYNEFNNGDFVENTSCKYVSTFNGTSSAAPTVSGVIALMLEANADLTWRDVKHILVTTSDKVDPTRAASVSDVIQYQWVTNAAGHEHHNWYGFGKINAAAAVASAKSYTANSLGTFVDTGYVNIAVNGTIPDNSSGTVTKEITKPVGSNGIIEYVRVSVDFDHSAPSTVGFRLQSPSGTIINLMQPGTNINNPGGAYTVDIGASGFYGETMEGTWTIEVSDYLAGTTGTLQNWGLQIYGN
tara:strand:- start:7535 stop:12331 length:4797 start_codon:yes stop_codon:yes gene_type:complete